MDAADIQARIDKIKAQIDAIDEAIIAILVNKVESYTLDTGQSRQTVTRQNVTDLIESQNVLMNTCVTLEARLNGSGVSYGGGFW